jgi:peptidoglycan/xylan/chitin deacetylase (PgdA/CDA1 family)
MHYGVGPLRKGFDPYLTVLPELLERHLGWIRTQGYTPIHVSNWIAYQCEGASLPQKPILLTFDDAYRDLAEF